MDKTLHTEKAVHPAHAEPQSVPQQSAALRQKSFNNLGSPVPRRTREVAKTAWPAPCLNVSGDWWIRDTDRSIGQSVLGSLLVPGPEGPGNFGRLWFFPQLIWLPLVTHGDGREQGKAGPCKVLLTSHRRWRFSRGSGNVCPFAGTWVTNHTSLLCLRSVHASEFANLVGYPRFRVGK